MAYPPWINIFGGGPVWPSSVSYISYDLDTIGMSITLQFPQVATTQYVTAGTINVLTSNTANTITFPDVTIVSPGYTMWVRNSGSVNLTLYKNDGTLLVVIDPGLTWFIQVIDNTTPAGGWFTGQFGAGSSTVNPAALAGPGLIVNPLNATQLATNIVAREFNTAYTVLPTDRATLLVWTGGTETLTLPTVFVPGFIFYVSNISTGGILTIESAGGTPLINGAASITCNPGNSFEIDAGPVNYYTIGTPQFNFSNFTFPDGSSSNPSINFASDHAAGFSFLKTSAAPLIEQLQISLNGILQAAFFTNTGVSGASFANLVSAQYFESVAGQYVFGTDPTKSRLELDAISGGQKALNFFAYNQAGSAFTNMQLVSSGYLNLVQADFQRDAISYLAWMRTMI